MKTITFKIIYNEEARSIIEDDSRVYSSIVRYSLERFYEGLGTTSVYQDIVKKFNIGSHLCNCALREANSLFKRFKNNESKIIFGDFKRYNKGLISKGEFKQSRNRGVCSEGETPQLGNRHFKIDLQNQTIIYKRNRKEHIKLVINEQLRGKRKNLLEKIYLTMSNKLSPVSFRIRNDNLYITYDETIIESYKKYKDLKSNRVLGLDLNPNYIGLSIIDFNSQDEFKIIHKQVFDLSILNEQSTNKVKYELQQIDNQILKLCKHYRVSKLAIEELNFKKSNKFWSKSLNRLCKNKFRYSQINNHLSTLCNTFGVELIEVNSAYSSFVGNFQYGSSTTPDMIASSIEIARRAYKKFSKEWFYPAMPCIARIKEVLGNQWKEKLKLDYKSWKTFFNQIKKLKLKYRFPLDGGEVFKKNYHKTKVILYNFGCFI